MHKVIDQTDRYAARTGMKRYFIYDGRFLIFVDRVEHDSNPDILPVMMATTKHEVI
jgi:hypothetical protein